MKNQRAVKSRTAVSPLAASVPSTQSDNSPTFQRHQQLLERWRRLATGLRGVRLFKVTLPRAGRIFWEAECTLNGADVSRRFASELHARAWLSVATQSRISVSSVERQELDRPCSTSCFASGG
jgi:alpha-amylase/alpha-mannosidase (GH57 family)